MLTFYYEPCFRIITDGYVLRQMRHRAKGIVKDFREGSSGTLVAGPKEKGSRRTAARNEIEFLLNYLPNFSKNLQNVSIPR
jgi:hypothetical protein